MMLIYKIASTTEWEEATRTGAYRGSPDDRHDGFIHFSTAVQVAETARKHFAGRSDLVLIAVAVDALGADLKWEPSRGGALFPHLYAELPVGAAVWVEPLALDDAGRHVLPSAVRA
jgi:uncharacterized protein (DUF952 family)